MKAKKFTFYAYYPPTSGSYFVNGYEYRTIEDFRTAKYCKDYKDCGFELLQLRYGHAYNGEPWETSNTNIMWNAAYEAGIRKFLITDLRIEKLIRFKKGTPTDIHKTMTEQELDDLIASFVAPYKDKEGFYGIQLLDEPKMHELPDYGAVAKSIKRVLPNAYVQINLHPLGTIILDGMNSRQSYEVYANEALNATELDHICFDEYPFRREYIISGNTMPNYQIMAKVCKQRGVEMQAVLQSFANASGGRYLKRKINESDMYWQTNLAMGFGVREYSFYTYMPKPNFSYEKGGDGVDGACFINLDGSKTALYSYTKRIIKEMKKFSKIALKYEYENNYFVFEQGKTKNDFEQTVYAEECEACPFPISIDRGIALVTEQKNGENRLFMIENVGNVRDELFDGVPPMQVEFSLPAGKKTFYSRGEKIDVKETDGKFVHGLKVGEAVFIELER